MHLASSMMQPHWIIIFSNVITAHASNVEQVHFLFALLFSEVSFSPRIIHAPVSWPSATTCQCSRHMCHRYVFRDRLLSLFIALGCLPWMPFCWSELIGWSTLKTWICLRLPYDLSYKLWMMIYLKPAAFIYYALQVGIFRSASKRKRKCG